MKSRLPFSILSSNSIQNKFWLLKSLMWQNLLWDSLKLVDLFQTSSVKLPLAFMYYKIMRCFSCSNLNRRIFAFQNRLKDSLAARDNSKHSLISAVPQLNKSPNYVIYVFCLLFIFYCTPSKYSPRRHNHKFFEFFLLIFIKL